jgi:hypothetical protein
VVGRRERTAGDAVEGLERVSVVVGRAMVEDQLPAQRRGRERAVLRVGRTARELDALVDPPRRAGGRGEVIVAVGAVLPTVIVTEAVLAAPWLSVTRRLAVQTPWLV